MQGKRTRQHQIHIAGKGEGITRDDLLQLGCARIVLHIHTMLRLMYAIRDMDTSITLLRLAEELRRRRRARGLTQAHLAKAAGVSRSLVVRAEKADETVAIGTFANLLWLTGGELTVGAARRPTLDEARVLFAADED